MSFRSFCFLLPVFSSYTQNPNFPTCVHVQECVNVQSANEKISGPDWSRARAPSCDVTANDSKWVELFAGPDQWLPQEKSLRFTQSAVLLFLKWMEFVITAWPPSDCPLRHSAENSKTPAAFLMFDTTCRHTHVHTFDKGEHMHVCIIRLMPCGKVVKGHKMFWRLEELMACDLPATTMTLLTC